MNPLTSPTAMAIGNAAVGIYGALEGSGVLSLLGTNKYGGWAILAIAALNGIAHAVSPPTSGPLVSKGLVAR